MPKRSYKPCKKIGCSNLVEYPNIYCDLHKNLQNMVRKEYDKKRGSAARRGYDSRWNKYRIIFLRDNPLCVECLKHNKLTPAKVVDHIKPHKGDYKLFWDLNNHQALCEECHNRKTATEDGGFGNRG